MKNDEFNIRRVTRDLFDLAHAPDPAQFGQKTSFVRLVRRHAHSRVQPRYLTLGHRAYGPLLSWALLAIVSFGLATTRVMAAPANSPDTTNNSIAEKFKAFISSPPLIEEMIFDRKVIARSKGTNSLDLAASTNYQRYVARWQPNARFIYQILPPNVTTNIVMNRFSIAVYERKHWNLVPEGFLNIWHDDGVAPGPKAEANSVREADHLLSYRLAEVLNMGVYSLPIGSIRWQGNSFSATNSRLNLKFKADLIPSGSGFPEKLLLRSQVNTNVFEFELLYSFDRDVGVACVPSQIQCVEITGGNKRERNLIRIQSIKLAAEPAAETAFLPKTHLMAMPVELRIYTNSAYYTLDGNGRMVRDVSRRVQLIRVNQDRYLYLAVSALVSVVIFALMVRAKLKPS